MAGTYKDFLTAKFREGVAKVPFLTFQSLLHHELLTQCSSSLWGHQGSPSVTGHSSLFGLAVGSKSDLLPFMHFFPLLIISVTYAIENFGKRHL